jgi:hypothetical protein
MSKTMKPDSSTNLPAPIALTPDELQQIATTTAGGVSLATVVVIRAGGIILPVIRAGGIMVAQ